MSEFNRVGTLLTIETCVNSIINNEIEDVIRGYGKNKRRPMG